MSQKRHPLKIITKNSTRFIRRFLANIKKQLIWLLRTVFSSQKQQQAANAGFVLPTVVMVSVVVVLLTTAIMFRSFERAKNASNVRVNESVITAATPAIDRGKAKISKLFQDKTLSKTTPTDNDLYNALVNNIDKYTFGDETKLTLSLQGQPSLQTAWRFPVDTDSNGRFDSYTLYGIYFKTPPVLNGQYSRARNALEARNVPVVKGTLNANCGSTNTSLVGNTGWVRQDNEIKKAFFVYTAVARITDPPNINYEVYNRDIPNSLAGAVEYQQDRVQTPTNNNAVVYDDDLELNSSTNLNGGVFTNSNLLAAGSVSNISNLRLYQVSSKASCFYKPKNAKIIVGGNLALGRFTDASDTGGATVDLYQGKTSNVTTGTLTKSVTNSPKDTAYNNLAYVKRINKLIDAQIAADSTNDPTEVKNGLALKQTALGITFNSTETTKYRRQQLEIYFKRRTRRVPYTEVAVGATETYPNSLLQGSADTLRPIDSWVYPTDPTDGKTGGSYTNLSLNISGTSLEPNVSDPKELKKNSGKEGLLGDRVLVSNNLPELRWDTSKNQFIGSYTEDTQDITGITWDLPSGTTQTRTRPSLVRNLADIGSTERDGDWELAAAKVPTSTTGPVGGLRVVTGAGVYLSKNDTPSSINSNVKTIWPDNAVTISSTDTTTPYLKMRATAVYHYKSTGYNAQTPNPIACVSSYYDPTDNKSYKNMNSLPSASNLEKDKDGKSNRGIVYPAPTRTESYYSSVLTYLSELKYNNIRLIDDGLLARALAKKLAPTNRTISEQSAIDAQICALQILDGSLSPVSNNPVIPHGAIFETFFSDQRETQKVRATVLDLNLLRTKTIGSSEYLLPNSGIIYATRDDALPDISAGNTDAEKLESPVDYVDDTTRRPSAIILINGGNLGRTNSYKEEEKGLTLATNLPAYIKGDFNLHTQEEFPTLADDWSNFYTRTTFNNNFACRSGDSRFPDCTTGDEWRPGNILADAVTLLSGDFDFKELGYTIGSQQTAKNDTTFNLIIAAGDNPAKPTVDNGGLNNLVRVIENWTSRKIKLNGAFMQVKKSAYATGTNPPQTLNNPPTRQWSYDVGLLFQSPDLFASKLAVTPPEPPDEYLREVSRGDTWVQTLLCARETSNPPTNPPTNFAITDQKQRPDSCQS
jgi:Tfp pilus assembly protein PilX